MSNNIEALMADMKAAAELSKELSGISGYRKATESNARFKQLATEENVLKLIVALEQSQQYTKQRDEENQDLMLTIGKLRVEREQLEASALCVKPTDAMREVAPLCVKLPAAVDSSNVPFAANGWNAYREEAIKAIRAAGGTIEGSD